MARLHYIVSDVHLGAVPENTERAFIDFLGAVGADGEALLLVGDLFDFWFEWGSVIPGRHFRVLAALAELVDAGIRVEMVGGNHDAWGGSFLRDEVGVRFSANPFRTEIAGRAALVAHGDGVGRGDLKYRMLKAFIRSRPAITAFRALHPELGVRLAQAVSTTEGKGESDDAARGRGRYIEAWARNTLLEQRDLGWVVCGHAHLPAIQQVEPGRYYVNSGDWVNHDTYIVVGADGAPELRHWPRGG